MLLKSDLDVQQTPYEAGLLNKSSNLAPALGLTKFVIHIDIILGRTLLCYLSRTWMSNKPASERCLSSIYTCDNTNAVMASDGNFVKIGMKIVLLSD